MAIVNGVASHLAEVLFWKEPVGNGELLVQTGDKADAASPSSRDGNNGPGVYMAGSLSLVTKKCLGLPLDMVASWGSKLIFDCYY